MSREAAVEHLAAQSEVELFAPELAGSDHREALVLEPRDDGFRLRRQDLEHPGGLRPVSHAMLEGQWLERDGVRQLAIELRVDRRPLPMSTAQRLWSVMALAMSVPFFPLIAMSGMAAAAKVGAFIALVAMHVILARVIHVLPRQKRTQADAKQLGAIVEGAFAPLEPAIESAGQFRR